MKKRLWSALLVVPCVLGLTREAAAAKSVNGPNEGHILDVQVVEPQECLIVVDGRILVDEGRRAIFAPAAIPAFPEGRYDIVIAKRGFGDKRVRKYRVKKGAKPIHVKLRAGESQVHRRVLGSVSIDELRATPLPRSRRKRRKKLVLDQTVADPQGNLTGDLSRKFLDITGASVERRGPSYVFTIAAAGHFPRQAEMGPGKRFDFIWFIDIDRRTDTGQSKSGNDYNIHMVMDARGWHTSFFEASDVSKAHDVAINRKEFDIQAENNLVRLCFPARFLPLHHFYWWVTAGTGNARNWPPKTSHPMTASSEFGGPLSESK